MRLYLAALYTSNFDINGRIFQTLTDAEKLARVNVRYHLESYHYIHRASFINKIRGDSKKVFLDSGAFSAFSLGAKVDLPKYCDWIKKHEDIVEHASVLDSIGSAQGTFDNQIAMEKLGVSPLPCYHYGEDPRFLEYYVANYEYITIGGMVPITRPQLKLWLDEIWEKYLTDGSGRPKLKVHGFGLTSVELMARYPWYSVDSSSWVQIAANGNVIHPDIGVVEISERHPSRKVRGRHYLNEPEINQKRIKEILEENGFELERLQDNYKARWSYNCWSYTKMNDNRMLDNECFVRVQPGLF